MTKREKLAAHYEAEAAEALSQREDTPMRIEHIALAVVDFVWPVIAMGGAIYLARAAALAALGL